MDEQTLAWLAAMGATIVTASDGVGVAYLNTTSPEEAAKLKAELSKRLQGAAGLVSMKSMNTCDFRILEELENTRKLVAERESARRDIMDEVEQVAEKRMSDEAASDFGIGIDETVDEPFKDPVKQAVADALCDMVARSRIDAQDLRDTEAPWLFDRPTEAEDKAYDAAENYAKGLGSIWGDADYARERSRVEEKEALLSEDLATYHAQKSIFDHMREVQAKRSEEVLMGLHSYPDAQLPEKRPNKQLLRQAFMDFWSEWGEGEWTEDDYQMFKDLNKWMKRIERR